MKRLRLRTNFDNWLTYGLVIVAYIAVRLLLAGGNISYALQGQLVPITVYIVMAVLAEFLTVGVLGELSLGHAGFMSVRRFQRSDYRYVIGAISRYDVDDAWTTPWTFYALDSVRFLGHAYRWNHRRYLRPFL